MADFDGVVITSGGNVKAYVEASSPPKSNPVDGIPPRYKWVENLNPGPIRFEAVVEGVTGPAEATLGGRGFAWSWVYWPGFPTAWSGGVLPVLDSPISGDSSVLDVLNFPDSVLATFGIWALCCRRASGGSILVPFRVETVI